MIDAQSESPKARKDVKLLKKKKVKEKSTLFTE